MAGSTVINLESTVRQFTTVDTAAACDKREMPSVGCPVFACLCFFPVGFGALIYYLKARGSQDSSDDPKVYLKSIVCVRNLTIAAILLGVASILLGIAIGISLIGG